MSDWQIIDLDPRAAAKRSVPPRIVVPPDEPAPPPDAVNRSVTAAWAVRFRAEHPDHPIAASLVALVEKEPVWVAAEPLLVAEQWPETLPLIERILAIDPTDMPARFNYASALRATGAAETALNELLSVEPVFGDEGVYHANVARTYEVLGRNDAAVAAYRHALELLPGDGFVLERLAALGVLVQAFDEQGEMLYVDTAEFANSVREDLAAHADDADYLVGVADMMLQAGHHDLARNAAELALAAAPGRADALLLLGASLAQTGRLDDALQALDQHVTAEPTSALGHASRSQVLYAAGRVDDARAAATRALELNPNDLTAIQVLVAGDDGADAALGRARTVIDRYPGAWGPLRIAGDLALTSGDQATAIGYWRAAVGAGADDATLGTLLGELGRAGMIDELVEIADGITRLADRDAGLRWNIASGYAEAGRGDEARIVFAMIAHDERVPAEMRAAATQRAAELSA
jgi:tetratricopeptide (TPR) repeat protein